MESERLITSLYARRRRPTLGLKDFERRTKVYRSAIMALESRLQALRPSVPAFKPRRPSQYFTSREFAHGYHDAVREADTATLTVILRQCADCLIENRNLFAQLSPRRKHRSDDRGQVITIREQSLDPSVEWKTAHCAR